MDLLEAEVCRSSAGHFQAGHAASSSEVLLLVKGPVPTDTSPCGMAGAGSGTCQNA